MSATSGESERHRHEPVEEWPYGLTLTRDYAVDEGPVWAQASHLPTAGGLPAQGWKLHVSARPATCVPVMTVAAEALVARGVTFKAARSAQVLQALNDGAHGQAAIGKFITVYPPADAVVEVGQLLAEELRGLDGPRIPSDRRIRPDAPVYYRYGPFAPRLGRDSEGRRGLMLTGPDGTNWLGEAQPHYVAVPWAKDPFHPAADRPRRADAPIVLGGFYAVTGAVGRSLRGATYRAIDNRDGRRLIIKQARAFVNESSRGDARDYLRHERSVLARLAGVPGIPEVVDHFRAGDDEYLVITELGGRDLRFDVLQHGLYASGGRGGRRVRDLAIALLRVLDEAHARGVVVRDLAPKNVIVQGPGELGLVDFELASLDGRQQFGWSPGYSTPRQRQHQPAEPADDLYSLGGTLHYAVTGIDPFLRADDGSVNLDASLHCLGEVAGHGSPAYRLVARLLSPEAADREAAARVVRSGRWPASLRSSAAVGPRAPIGQPGATAGCEARALACAVSAAESLLAQAAGPGGSHADVTARSGLAGLAAELALHPSAVDLAVRIARACAEAAGRAGLEPGLMFGRSGVAVAVHRVGVLAADSALREAGLALLPDVRDVDVLVELDVSRGVAGVCLAAVALGADDVRDRCRARLADGDEQWTHQAASLPTGNPAHAISIADGFAHGSAGIAFALHRGEHSSALRPDGWSAGPRLAAVADTATDVAVRAGRPTARPMAASWCQGLAGMGTALVRAGVATGDSSLIQAAEACATPAAAVVVRSPALSQCCGVAGVGDFLIDLAIATGQDTYLHRARGLMDCIDRRGGLAVPAERAIAPPWSSDAFGWGDGVAGILAFARRLARPESPRHWLGG